MSILFLVLSGLSEIGKKILNNNDQLEENADFGHFRPFLACFWPVLVEIRHSAVRSANCSCRKSAFSLINSLRGQNEII